MAQIVFPLLLVCGAFAVMILVAIISTYFLLLWYNAQATKCPECGRKGGGEVVDSNVIDSKTYTQWKDARTMFRRDPARRPVRVTEKTYEDHFVCKHCGHKWIKAAREETHGPRPGE